MTPPLVSVILPAFDSEETLARALGSLLCQSWRNLEVIVVDDGSSDRSAEIAGRTGDARVRVIAHDRNRGAAAARNTGVAASEGELIAFHDADDIAVFDKIERQVAALEAAGRDCVAVYTGLLFYDSVLQSAYDSHADTRRRPLRGEGWSGDVAGHVLRKNFFNLPTLLVRRQAFEAIGGFDPKVPANEDWDFALRLSAAGPIAFDPEPLYLSIHHIGSRGFENKLSRSPRKAMVSYVVISNKLKRRGIPPEILAGHYATTAAHLMKGGRFGFARRYLRAALALGGSRRRIWPRLAAARFPDLYRLARR